jgi:xylan 1,4-beta-xylosidase
VPATSSGQVELTEIVAKGVRAAPDVGTLASRGAHKLTVMVWHYHDDDIAGPDAAVSLVLAGLPANLTTAKLTHHRIDQHHSNAYGEWLRLGSPVAPDPKQYAALEAASNLAVLKDSPAAVAIANGKATLDFTLPRQGVSLVTVEW